MDISDIRQVENLIGYEDYYRNTYNNLPYSAAPLLSGGYNSNSFTHGLLITAEIPIPYDALTKYTMHGWEKPLPSDYFGIIQWWRHIA